ncbi:MAG: ribonuclease J [Christensenellaceae bacterium]|jgi:ribonuclease J|nr:ribonuclease J [Christensenellaceae bacterium]
MNKNVKISFIGGIGEIGKNMTAFECGDDIIVVDAGLGFPDDTMPGVDMVVCDISYLIKNKSKIRGYIFTHGHEDHIGGVVHALRDAPADVYGSRFTLGLIESKLRENPGIKVRAVAVKARSAVKIGVEFVVEFVNVNHSIPGSFALAIRTPAGIIFHTGDFKIDLTPLDNNPIDLTRIAEIGRQGVALLLCESTNIEHSGFSMSETTISEHMDELFARYKDKRIFVSAFSSHVHRIQQMIDLAVKYKRKIAFAGRSMLKVSDIAIRLGEMKALPANIIEIEKVGSYKPEEVLVILTGSQGEPRSALQRMASGEFPKINLGPTDAVVFSAYPIPGNEEAVNSVINNLIFRGVSVIYESQYAVHVSGHACEEEIKLIHALVKPRYFIPVHGEYKMLKKHLQLAEGLGMNKRNMFMAELGDCFELSPTVLKKVGQIASGARLVDGLGYGDIDSSVLRDRLALADDGICVVGVVIDGRGEVLGQPQIVPRGLVYGNEIEKIIKEGKEVISGIVSKAGADIDELRNELRKGLQNYFQKALGRRPIIVSIIQKV